VRSAERRRVVPHRGPSGAGQRTPRKGRARPPGHPRSRRHVCDEEHSEDEDRFLAVGPIARGVVVVVHRSPAPQDHPRGGHIRTERRQVRAASPERHHGGCAGGFRLRPRREARRSLRARSRIVGDAGRADRVTGGLVATEGVEIDSNRRNCLSAEPGAASTLGGACCERPRECEPRPRTP
jgi:hypothetical protein